MSAIERKVRLVNQHGLHARPISRVAEVAQKFSAALEIDHDGRSADGRSILELMTLAAGPGTEILLRADGDDGEALLDALCELIESGFGEDLL